MGGKQVPSLILVTDNYILIPRSPENVFDSAGQIKTICSTLIEFLKKRVVDFSNLFPQQSLVEERFGDRLMTF